MYSRKIIIVVSIILILLLVFYNLKKTGRVSVIGSYESLSPSLYDKAKFAASGIECFYAGRQLNLLPDSTFTFVDYNNVLTGRWHQTKDLISLHFLSNKYLNDSLLNKFGTPGIPLADCYLNWNNPDLYRFFPDSSDGCVEIFSIKF